jgi:hypothetical protein
MAMITALDSFVSDVLSAHGGLERWRTFDTVSAQVIAGGFLWPMKGMDIGTAPRTITGEFRRQRVRVEPFGEPDWYMTYTPERIAIQTQGGALIAEQQNPRETFAGHTWETAWNPLQLAYFNGYAMWTYYNLPFVLAEPGFEVVEIPPITQDGLALRGLRVVFPKHIHTHCAEQNLYFDADGLLRRQDYEVDVAGKSRAGHLISEYVEVQGLKLATKRRVFMRKQDDSLQFDQMPVSIDLSEFRLGHGAI